jgi:invasion protein IalB
MNRGWPSLVFAFAGALLIAPCGRALAQQSTTATYGDWVVRCHEESTKPPKKTCDMEQLTEVQGKGTPLSRAILVHPQHGQPVNLIVQLPVNVWLGSGIKLQIDKTQPDIPGQFTRCVPAGCFANIVLNEAALKAFRVASKPGEIIFKNAGGHDIAIPLSFKGFAQSFDALAKD